MLYDVMVAFRPERDRQNIHVLYILVHIHDKREEKHVCVCVPVKRYPETGGLERETGVVCVCFSGGMSEKMPAHQVGVGYLFVGGG